VSYVSRSPGLHQGGHAGVSDPRSHAVSARQRERGLSVVARANRWMITGAVALAGAASAVTAHAFQAHNKNVSAPAVTQTDAHHHSDDASHTGGQSPAASAAPSTAPAPAPAPAPVVSGGS
jgi:hypothetical protein